MQTPARSPLPAAQSSRFPLVFEGLVWVLHVGVYQSGKLLEGTILGGRPLPAAVPYPQLLLFAVVATLYMLPYYRGLVPVLLRRQQPEPNDSLLTKLRLWIMAPEKPQCQCFQCELDFEG